jgi:hypothetical protein
VAVPEHTQPLTLHQCVCVCVCVRYVGRTRAHTDADPTVMLQWCHSGVTVVLPEHTQTLTLHVFTFVSIVTPL